MSQFSDLINDVYTVTNRPELVAETALALRQETLAAHRSDYYMKDQTKVLITFTSAAILQISISNLFPNWRAFSYLRPYDPVTQSPSPILIARDSFIKPDAIFDEYMAEKVNVAYTAGDNLNVKLQAAYGGMLVGYYKNPVLSPDANFDSWIGREQPALLIIGAAERVLTSIGWEEAAARMRIMLFGNAPGASRSAPSGGEYMLLKQSNIEEFGR